MRFRLAAAVPASGRLRCLTVRACTTYAAPFPYPRAVVGPRGSGDVDLSLACDSASVRRRPRSGASSANFDIDRLTR